MQLSAPKWQIQPTAVARLIIIYSNPIDDGYGKGVVYPLGAFKHETGVHRGSVMGMPLYLSNPLTPDVGSTATASRLNRLQATNLHKIPVLLISYKDAQPLLAAIGNRLGILRYGEFPFL